MLYNLRMHVYRCHEQQTVLPAFLTNLAQSCPRSSGLRAHCSAGLGSLYTVLYLGAIDRVCTHLSDGSSPPFIRRFIRLILDGCRCLACLYQHEHRFMTGVIHARMTDVGFHGLGERRNTELGLTRADYNYGFLIMPCAMCRRTPNWELHAPAPNLHSSGANLHSSGIHSSHSNLLASVLHSPGLQASGLRVPGLHRSNLRTSNLHTSNHQAVWRRLSLRSTGIRTSKVIFRSSALWWL